MSLAFVGTNGYQAVAGMPPPASTNRQVGEAIAASVGRVVPNKDVIGMERPNCTPTCQILLDKYNTAHKTVLFSKPSKGQLVLSVTLRMYSEGRHTTDNRYNVTLPLLNLLLKEHDAVMSSLVKARGAFVYTRKGVSDSTASAQRSYVRGSSGSTTYDTKGAAPSPFQCKPNGDVNTTDIQIVGVIGPEDDTTPRITTQSEASILSAMKDTLSVQAVSMSCAGGGASAPVPLDFVSLTSGTRTNKSYTPRASGVTRGMNRLGYRVDYSIQNCLGVYIGHVTHVSLGKDASHLMAIPVVYTKASHNKWYNTKGYGSHFLFQWKSSYSGDYVKAALLPVGTIAISRSAEEDVRMSKTMDSILTFHASDRPSLGLSNSNSKARVFLRDR